MIDLETATIIGGMVLAGRIDSVLGFSGRVIGYVKGARRWETARVRRAMDAADQAEQLRAIVENAPALVDLAAASQLILHELTPNSGTSFRDRVVVRLDDIDTHLERIDGRLEEGAIRLARLDHDREH